MLLSARIFLDEGYIDIILFEKYLIDDQKSSHQTVIIRSAAYSGRFADVFRP
jgi:hypothetical protein